MVFNAQSIYIAAAVESPLKTLQSSMTHLGHGRWGAGVARSAHLWWVGCTRGLNQCLHFHIRQGGVAQTARRTDGPLSAFCLWPVELEPLDPRGTAAQHYVTRDVSNMKPLHLGINLGRAYQHGSNLWQEQQKQRDPNQISMPVLISNIISDFAGCQTGWVMHILLTLAVQEFHLEFGGGTHDGRDGGGQPRLHPAHMLCWLT